MTEEVRCLDFADDNPHLWEAYRGTMRLKYCATPKPALIEFTDKALEVGPQALVVAVHIRLGAHVQLTHQMITQFTAQANFAQPQPAVGDHSTLQAG